MAAKAKESLEKKLPKPVTKDWTTEESKKLSKEDKTMPGNSGNDNEDKHLTNTESQDTKQVERPSENKGTSPPMNVLIPRGAVNGPKARCVFHHKNIDTCLSLVFMSLHVSMLFFYM